MKGPVRGAYFKLIKMYSETSNTLSNPIKSSLKVSTLLAISKSFSYKLLMWNIYAKKAFS